MTRKRTDWKFRDHSLTLGERTLIVGVLNVTPDSFSDGGKYLEPDAAVAARARDCRQQGADILDIGAESHGPDPNGSPSEELRRLIPVLKKLKGKLDHSDLCDTYKAGVAELALKHGASIINDVSGLTWEPDLVKIVMQIRRRPDPEPHARHAGDLGATRPHARCDGRSLARRTRGGRPPRSPWQVSIADRIVDRPWHRLRKAREQNSEILARLGELAAVEFAGVGGGFTQVLPVAGRSESARIRDRRGGDDARF